jgi:protoheme ferro-lyase
VAVIFVGHGEPATVADGDIAIAFPDGGEFGPHAESLGVPTDMQHTEWAAAYDEISMAMTYIFGDLNQNGEAHEMQVSPQGDVPPFFTWEAFHDEIVEVYGSFGDYSPHNDLLTEHVDSLDLEVDGAEIDTYLAFLDAVPRIPDVMGEIDSDHDYDKIVLVPMLLASSTHTQEVADQVAEFGHLTGNAELVVTEPFFEVPFMRQRVKDAVLTMADYLRQSVPAGVADSDIGVLLASHGTPYVPALDEFGYQEGEIFSNLLLTEDLFHDEVIAELPWPARTGRMNYASPSIEESLAAFAGDGITHVIVVPSAFPTAAMHTMKDVAESAIGRTVTPDEGIVTHTHSSGLTVYYTSDGYADLDEGRDQFRAGLAFIAEIGVHEALAGDL